EDRYRQLKRGTSLDCEDLMLQWYAKPTEEYQPMFDSLKAVHLRCKDGMYPQQTLPTYLEDSDREMSLETLIRAGKKFDLLFSKDTYAGTRFHYWRDELERFLEANKINRRKNAERFQAFSRNVYAHHIDAQVRCLLALDPDGCAAMQTDLYALLRGMTRIFAGVDRYAEALDNWRELSMPEGKIDPTEFLQDLAEAEADTMGLRRELLDKQPQLKSWLWLPAAHNRFVMLKGAISSQAKAEVKKLRVGPTDTFHTLESALYKVAGEFDWGNLSSSASDSSSEEEELPPIRIKR
ncbi:MAG: hypothetical protein GY738_18520, partial [Pseudoalteromonas sp.]|nr:hypothetical protein [Pseudoalteromonas sp.]